MLFSIGHALLAIGFWIRNKIIDPRTSCDRFCNRVFVCFFYCQKHVDKYKCAAKRACELLPRDLVVGCESKTDVHLALEMFVLLKQPRLHAVFIERYNTLWHLRLGLAAAFLSAGVLNLAHAICSLLLKICTWDQCFQVVVGLIVGSISIGFGWQLMRQHLTTNTNFLRRVIVAFKLSERQNA